MRDKTNKNRNFKNVFEEIQKAVESVTEFNKKTRLLNWLKDFSKYILYEPKFKAKDLKKYNPGDLLDINFGYNIGSELSGPHFGVVIEDNSRKDRTIVVIPLSSYGSPDEIHHKEIDLGVLVRLNEYKKSKKNLGSKAKISHIRSVSKQRIYYPIRPEQTLGKLNNNQLQLIYNEIINRYCSKF